MRIIFKIFLSSSLANSINDDNLALPRGGPKGAVCKSSRTPSAFPRGSGAATVGCGSARQDWLDQCRPRDQHVLHRAPAPKTCRSRLSSMVIQAVTTQRLYQQVAEQITNLIQTGAFPLGSKLPAERDLALQFGISRPTVREALIALRSRASSMSGPVRAQPSCNARRRSSKNAPGQADVGPSPFELIADAQTDRAGHCRPRRAKEDESRPGAAVRHPRPLRK